MGSGVLSEESSIGTCETQGLLQAMTLLRGLLGGSQGQALDCSNSMRLIVFFPDSSLRDPRDLSSVRVRAVISIFPMLQACRRQ